MIPQEVKMELVWSHPPGLVVALPGDFCAQGLEVTPREPPVARICVRYPIDEKKIPFYKLGEKEVGFGAWR